MVPIAVSLPDGRKLELEKGATAGDAAKAIGRRLGEAALAARVNGAAVDLSTPLLDGAALEILTWDSPAGREVFRHTTSHIMAQAVMRLYPGAKLTIGPPIEDGFYYDIAFPSPISSEDLPRIEKEMEKVVAENFSMQRHEVVLEEIRDRYEKAGNEFKVELLDDLRSKGETKVSWYEQGEFWDLCRGPHIPSTGKVKALKLLSVAGAYWRGDEKREMLTRIYGVSFPSKKELDEHLHLLEEARKRDHRKIGRDLRLFAFHDEGPGFPFFLPGGVALYNALVESCRQELRKRDYVEIKTPMILNEQLWHRSGHWDNYKENMYFTDIEEKVYAVKPMNCPGGLLVYNQDLHSYRDLPLRVAEFGLVHRHELSGVLHGLLRVRCFTQDDAHIFCTEDQLKSEIRGMIELTTQMYKQFGFDEYELKLATRPAKSVGSDEVWEKATSALSDTMDEMGIQYGVNPGEGVFYGPKIEFHIKDCLKRTWQCGTIQVDFSMPERFDLSYIGADGGRHRPVMVHRAIFGSIERFLGILTEHWAGDFPLWLAPVQAIVLPISSDQIDAARDVQRQLRDAGIRTELDFSDEKIGKKIREAEMRKIPLMLVLGKKEAESGSVSVRRRHLGDQGAMALDALIARTQSEVSTRLNEAPKAA